VYPVLFFSSEEIEVLVSYLQHSKAGREILSQITDAYRQSLESQCFHNIGYLFRILPPHSSLRASLISILARNLPITDALSLTGMGRSYINRVRRSPPGDGSPLFVSITIPPKGESTKVVGQSSHISASPTLPHAETCPEGYPHVPPHARPQPRAVAT
jgi:hypothetical protein